MGLGASGSASASPSRFVRSFLEGRRRLFIFEPGAVFEMRERRVACLVERFRRLVGAFEDLWVGLEGEGWEG